MASVVKTSDAKRYCTEHSYKQIMNEYTQGRFEDFLEKIARNGSVTTVQPVTEISDYSKK